jgi:hypothetical protein
LQVNVTEYRRSNQKWQSKETGNIGYTRPRKEEKPQNIICVRHCYAQTNTSNVNKIIQIDYTMIV